MIPHPPGWTVSQVAGAEILIPVEGPEACLIRYLERLAPVRPVSDLLEEQLATDPDFVVETASRPLDIVTDEGEYGALVTVTGFVDGDHVQRNIGYVFGENHYARIGGVARRTALYRRLEETVALLVRRSTQMLGTRRRPFRYAPPPGWTIGHVWPTCEWLAPGFPDDPAAITVWPAMPLALGGSAFASGFAKRGGPPSVPVSSRHGLYGQKWESVVELDDGRKGTRTLALFQDERYVYPVRMDGCAGAYEDVCAELLSSAEPIPRSDGSTHDAKSELASIWV